MRVYGQTLWVTRTGEPVVVARWLRLCGDPVDHCHKCPYGALSEDGQGCIEKLHEDAARLIERQIERK